MTENSAATERKKSPGFWRHAWLRFRRKKLSMCALMIVFFLSLVAIFSPMIAGTKPIVCKYKGKLYFPCMAYFIADWENPIFQKGLESFETRLL